jgi:HlyD family secretion protein
VSQRKIQSIARSEAIENFSSAEQLDQRLVLVRSRSWVVLLIIVAAMVLAIVWGVVGRVPHRISGEGLLIEKDRPVEVSSASGSGGVVELLVPVGEFVQVGQQIVVVANPQLDKQVDTATSYLATLKAQDVAMLRHDETLVAKQQSSVDAQIKLANETLKQTKQLISMYETEVANLEALAKQQLIPNSQLVQGRASLFTAMQQLTNQDSLIAQAQLGIETTLSTVAQGKVARAQEIAQAEDTLAKLTTQREQATSVYTPIAGKVIAHKVDLGSVIAPGGAVATILPMTTMGESLEQQDQSYTAIAYLPYGEGKEVRPGMSVVVSLPFAPPSRYGYIKGRVTSVEEYAVGRALAVHLGSSVVASDIQRQIGTSLEVEVALEVDPSTVSGLAWTSHGGYPEPIPLLSLCTVQVTVRNSRPIDLVIPWLKDMIGIDQPPKQFRGSKVSAQ